MNTPETSPPSKGVEPLGEEITEANRRVVEGKAVRRERDVAPWHQDRHLRASVSVGQSMSNAARVRLGYVPLATFPLTGKYAQLCLTLPREAREAKRGLWGP